MFLAKRAYFNKTNIIKGFITSVLLSAFIYLSWIGIELKILDTLLGLIGIYFVLTSQRTTLFYTGFFTGILWGYWMAVSLQYYDLVYIAPILLFGIGFVYGLIFLLFSIYNKVAFRALALFGFSFIAPFGFNWVKPELIFINSYLGTSKIDFFIILLSLFLAVKLKKHKILALIPLLFALSFEKGEYIDKPIAKIYMPQMNIEQNLKWGKDYQQELFTKNFEIINKAILEKNDLVVLPETAFTTPLNLNKKVLEELKALSYEIDIITGGLLVENKQIFNATYFISQGNVQTAKKVVLVPFGEKIPLPKFFVDLINNTFYGGASDYTSADSPTDFIIKGEKFRNAICYEATTDTIFENLGDTRYMIAISNNAWFTPSIEPILQDLLLKYYTKKYGVTLFHVVNGTPNKIYRP